MKKLLLFLCAILFGMSHAQTYYSQNFNTGGLNGWTTTDLDGDNRNWVVASAASVNSAFGSGSLISYSWNNVPLTPDNLVTSPLIDLTTVTAGNVFLLFDRQAGDAGYPAEKYSVYVTTTNVAGDIIATTPLLTETLPDNEFATKAVDLSPFIGQSVYISFRHYDCVDQYRIIVDNVTLKSLPPNDVALKKLNIAKFIVKDTNYPIAVLVENKGSNPITSLQITSNDGTNEIIETFSLNLAPGQQEVVAPPTPLNYASVAEKNLSVTITQVNGVADINPADNAISTSFRVVSQNSPKKVVFEEGTGTWCGWCPRGTVAMDYGTTTYPDNFIGIAVHNGDPMVLAAYNSGAGFSGFPGMNVDRLVKGTDISNSQVNRFIESRKNLVVPAELNASGTLVGRDLNITASATFRTVYSQANLRLAVVISEDGVRGTTTGYRQSNYYSGGGNGPMGGYENLPNPVPAAQMVYDHVGRALLGGYAGQPESVPTIITDGLVANQAFSYTIPDTYNLENMHLVVMLLDAGTGEIINARTVLLSTLGTTQAETNKNYLTIYPNPATEYFRIQADYNVDIQVYDASGKLALSKTNVSSNQNVPVKGLAKGVYIVKMQEKNSGKVKSQKLIIK